MGSEIRLGQLITPFGPGSIYTDKYGVPTVICGLDHWYKRKEDNGYYSESEPAVNNSTIVEPRLSDLLKVSHFRQPPENFYDSNNKDLSGLKVQGLRFPRWYVNSSNGSLKQFNLETERLTKPENGFWRPVRFVAVCQSGHMCDFPWKAWIGCTCKDEDGLVLNDSGGVDLSSITVRCKQCSNGKSLAGATVIHRNDNTNEVEETGLSKVNINCHGDKPWLGVDGGQGDCDSPLAAVMISQSNIYFANTVSAIFLPDLVATPAITKIQDALNGSHDLATAKIMFSLGSEELGMDALRKIVRRSLGDDMPSEDEIKNAYENLGRGRTAGLNVQKPKLPDSDLLAFRREEFNILRNEVVEGRSTELRIIPAELREVLQPFFSKVNLVERLRETKVFYGFDRLVRSAAPLDGMPESSMRQLFLNPPAPEVTWLPAVKSYGEGIYLELSEAALTEWLRKNSVWLNSRYNANFVSRMSIEPLLLPPSSNIDWQWAARYQLVHTLAHIIINQQVFESGYSSAALRERLFVSADPDAPMAGILIYTASGDSEGSLGGLVRLGRPELFENMIRRAISRASWCSADPVCSENLGGAGSRLVNMAACHACTLLPETACETINNGLDRAAVVGTPGRQDVGYLSALLGGYVV